MKHTGNYRLFALAMTAAFTVVAMGTPKSMTLFNKTYSIQAGSNLYKGKCIVCHETARGGKMLNPYGKDIQAAMRKANTKVLTAEILHATDDLDSNKNKVLNGKEIKQDKLPGATP